MRIRALLAAGAAVGTVAAGAFAGTPAQAAGTTTTYFGMNGKAGLVKFKVGGGDVASVNVLHAAGKGQTVVPTSFDGGWVAGYVLDAQGKGTLFTYNVKNDKFHLLSGISDNVQSAALYAGGAKVVFGNQLAHRVDIDHATVTGTHEGTRFTSKTKVPWSLAITDDGKRLFMTYTDSNSAKSDAVEITSKGLTSLTGGTKVMMPDYYASIALSPDESQVAFDHASFSSQVKNSIKVAPLKTDKATAIGYKGQPMRVTWTPGGKVLFSIMSGGLKTISMKGNVSSITGSAALANPVLG